MAAELAYGMGAAVVVAIDPIPERRTRAEMLGAVPSTPEVAEPFVTSVTGGRMIDSVIEAVGRTETVDLALAIVGVGRTVNVLGSGQNVRVEIPHAAAVNGVTVRANMLTEIARHWSQVVPMLLAGRIFANVREGRASGSFTLADPVPTGRGLGAVPGACPTAVLVATTW